MKKLAIGVDIGGISVVAMNNVPPHPANYLQRAGRAGRRREGRSLALAVCKNTPHDQSVFNDPLWPFKTPMRMPKVSLQSPDLVQRHINAWLLSYWLKQVAAADQIKSMTAGAFFLDGDIPMSLAARFCLWCNNQATELEPHISRSLKDITRRSILDSMPQPAILKRTTASLDEITQAWRLEHSASHEQLQQIGDKKAAAYRAMEVQVNRIEKEYLLSELVDRRFLPGYGFPTDIVSFDNRCMQTLKQEEADKRFAVVKWVLENAESKVFEVRVPRPDGDRFYITTVKPIINSQREVVSVICISKEITERKAMEERLARMAQFDTLTELPNRALFDDRLKHAIAQAKRDGTWLALMSIDLDRFKPVNDTHGHHVGDLLLQAVARRMQDCVRESDSVGRIGGDEFFILLPVIDHAADALTVAEKVRDALSRPFALEDTQAIGISSSIGITLYPDHGDDTRLLYRYADQAMYRAKAQGRNQTCTA